MPSTTSVHIDSSTANFSLANSSGVDGRPKFVVKDVSKKSMKLASQVKSKRYKKSTK